MNLPRWETNPEMLRQLTNSAAHEVASAGLAVALSDLEDRVSRPAERYSDASQEDLQRILEIDTLALAELRRQALLSTGVEECPGLAETLGCLTIAISAAENAVDEVAMAVILRAMQETREERTATKLEPVEVHTPKATTRARRWLSGLLHDLAYAIQPN